LDVKDIKGKWLEAIVVDLCDDSMRVHFKKFSNKWDEDVCKDESLINVKYAEVGKYSGAFGYAKFHKAKTEQNLNQK